MNCIGVNYFKAQDVNWKEWFYWYEEFCKNYDLSLNALGVSGANYGNSIKIKTFNRMKPKLEKLNFEKIESMDLISIEESDFDTSNYYTYSSIYPSEDFEISSGFIGIDEAILPLNERDVYKVIGVKTLQFINASFGYFYIKPLRKSPELYVRGRTQCAENDEEKKQLWQWDMAISNNRCDPTDLRQVYQLNFIRAGHLKREVFGMSLAEWIKSNPEHGTLEEHEDGIWIWEVSPENITLLNEKLKPTGLLVALRT